jgi:hypothetical protein
MTRATRTLIATLIAALSVISLAVAAPGHGPDGPQVRLASASGALALTNSHDGEAILDAPNLAPGGSVSGTAQIGNSGGTAGTLRLSATVESETPGAGGGRLSDALVVTVADGGTVVYRGTPAGLSDLALGTLAGGGSRTYDFTVELPESVTNAVQGARLSLGFQWTATEVAPTPPQPTPAPAAPAAPATPATPASPGAPATPAGPTKSVISLASAKRCVARGRLTVRLRPPAGTKVKRVDVKVGRKKAKRYRSGRRLVVKVPKARTKVSVTVRLSNGRRVSASARYRAC